MSSADSFSPRTTQQRLPTPLNGTLYVTTRLVAPEKPLPAIGETMETELGPAWADSLVIGVSNPPDKSQGVLTITHVRIPSEADQLFSNWEQTWIPIGGKQYPGVVRSVILLANDYQDDSPAIDSAMPVVAGGLFESDGYFLYERECAKSGIELEPTFRLDRRTYIKTTTLPGRIAYADRVPATTSESIVADGTAASAGLYIVDSRVTPLGNGKSVKETVTADSWPVHTGSRWDNRLSAPVLFTEQYVAPGVGLSTPYADVSIVNLHRNLLHKEIVPTEALKAYHEITPTRLNLGDLPRELISVNVVWQASFSVGTQDYDFAKSATGDSWSLEASHTDSASSAASIHPEVQFKFRDISSNVQGERHRFYVKAPVTLTKILGKLGAKAWPVFKPESETITCSGQSINVQASASASLSGTVSGGALVESGWSKGVSDDYSAGSTVTSIQIPACIHGHIRFSGMTRRFQLVSATAHIGITNSAVGSVISTKTKTGIAVGSVTPTFLPATGTVKTIPKSGLYLFDCDIDPPDRGFCLVTALVLNAKVLA